MHSVTFVSAVLALGAGLVAGQSTCTGDITISQPTPTFDCDVIAGDVTVDSSVAGTLSIEGPKHLHGNLNITGAQQLIGLSSSSITSIGGTMTLMDLNILSSVSMSSLQSLNTLHIQKLDQLPSLTFGSEGVTSANSVSIIDTFISDLSGLNLESVDTLIITQNSQLASFNSDLVNITGSLSITDNADSFVVNMTKLETAAEIILSQIKSFYVPALQTVSASLKFTTNPQLETFTAENLTSVIDSLTLSHNEALANVSFPALTKVTGDLTIVDNQELHAVEGFPVLKNVTGAILLGGNFTKFDVPKLQSVAGSVTVTSTGEISNVCDELNKYHSENVILGQVNCTSNNANANSGSGGSGSGSSGSGSSNSTSSAMTASVNFALLGLAAVAGFAEFM